ncbi:flagellar basal body rod protein [Bacillus aerolatus]|uniref:Flagellar basal body rod protein n=1 Tax=Bacillus aerolatus TaxID=2653354 RepID=A0A6I1FLV9_9BACI|nr:flagellar basal body rod protein [Bacillus aerolatus]KAB7704763.1 flagellar basal body rod protein [Bacillus aerolatus]
MKKVMLFCIGGLAALVAIASVGPVLGLVLCAAIMYVAWKQYGQASSKAIKFFWGAAGLIAFLAAVGNVPALLGIAALGVLYIVYKKWQEDDHEPMADAKEEDPFVNFEKQWNQLKKING